MREILFLGKRVDNGEWVEGGIKSITFLAGNTRYYIIPTCGEAVEVIPETVGQHTGLTDVNGKKIFEGDILEIRCGWEPLYRGVVAFVDYKFALTNVIDIDIEDGGKMTRTNDLGLDAFEYDDWNITIIGNKFDRPELLDKLSEVEND